MPASHAATSLILVAAAGCLPAPAAPAAGQERPEPVPEALVEYQITVATPTPSPATAAEPPAPPETAAAGFPSSMADPVPFQIGAGYAALGRVDLDDCRESGLQAGYVRVRATFTRVGYVVRASVASSAAPPPRALDCIADRLRQTGVPSFDGGEARLSKTYFVEPGTTPAP